MGCPLALLWSCWVIPGVLSSLQILRLGFSNCGPWTSITPQTCSVKKQEWGPDICVEHAFQGIQLHAGTPGPLLKIVFSAFRGPTGDSRVLRLW